MRIGARVIVLGVARIHERDLRARHGAVEIRLPAREPREDCAHRRQGAPVEQLRIAAVDVQPAVHAVGELLRDPRAVLGFRRRIQPPPRIEIADRHPARLVRRHRRQVFRLDTWPPGCRVAALTFECRHVLVREPVVDVPAAGPDGFERFHQLHCRDENSGGLGEMDGFVHMRDPRGDAAIAPFVEGKPGRFLPVFLERQLEAAVCLEQRFAGRAEAAVGVPRGKFSLVIPDAVDVVLRQHFAHDFRHAVAVITRVGTRDVKLVDRIKIACAIAREPVRMLIRQRARRATRIDAREHMNALRMRARHEFREQIAAVEARAFRVIRDARLVERDDAAAVDAEGRR